MKVSIDGNDIFEICEIKKRILEDYLPKECLEEDIKRRLFWVIDRLYEASFNQLKSNWEKKISEIHAIVPSNQEEYAALIFAHPEYKNRSQRDAEGHANKTSTFTVH